MKNRVEDELNFGKCKGMRLCDVQDSYVKWMVKTIEDSDPEEGSFLLNKWGARILQEAEFRSLPVSAAARSNVKEVSGMKASGNGKGPAMPIRDIETTLDEIEMDEIDLDEGADYLDIQAEVNGLSVKSSYQSDIIPISTIKQKNKVSLKIPNGEIEATFSLKGEIPDGSAIHISIEKMFDEGIFIPLDVLDSLPVDIVEEWIEKREAVGGLVKYIAEIARESLRSINIELLDSYNKGKARGIRSEHYGKYFVFLGVPKKGVRLIGITGTEQEAKNLLEFKAYISQ